MNTQPIPPPNLATSPARLKRITWSDLTSAQRKYARELYCDEGCCLYNYNTTSMTQCINWPLCEALLIAKFDGTVANG